MNHDRQHCQSSCCRLTPISHKGLLTCWLPTAPEASYLTVGPEEGEKLQEALHVEGSTLVQLGAPVMDVKHTHQGDICIEVTPHSIANPTVTDCGALNAGVFALTTSIIFWNQVHVKVQHTIAAESSNLKETETSVHCSCWQYQSKKDKNCNTMLLTLLIWERQELLSASKFHSFPLVQAHSFFFCGVKHQVF